MGVQKIHLWNIKGLSSKMFENQWTKCHLSVQILDMISIKYFFDKIHFYLNGGPQYFLFIYMVIQMKDLKYNFS